MLNKMTALIKPVEHFYQAQSSRDQRMLLLLLVSLTLALIWFVIITPLNNQRALQQSQANQAEQQYQWLLSQAPALQALQQINADKGDGPQNLSSLISNSSREFGLGITRLETTGGSNDPGVRVTLNNAEFNQVVLWLGELSLQYGIRVAQVQATNPNSQGRADIVLNLVRTD